MKRRLLLLLVFLTSPLLCETYWDWSKIDLSPQAIAKHFPDNFLWGTARCEYQDSGAVNCRHNQWAAEEKADLFIAQIIAPKVVEKRFIKGGQYSGVSADSWNKHQEDIGCMKQLLLNACRFSVEWSEIEPEEGKFNETVIEHYQQVCKDMLAAGITPMVTLHHFTHPQWFEEKGAFEKTKNVTYFVRFAKKIFAALSPQVKLWCTINEPGVIAFQNYIHGAFPPCKKGNYQLAGEVLRNLMIAHSYVYRELKQMENGAESQIGIVHNILQFETYHTSGYNPAYYLEKLITQTMSHIFTDAVMNFLTTGEFRFYIPTRADVRYTNSRIAERLDFIGLNYYSHVLVKAQAKLGEPICVAKRDHEIMTDMEYPIYAEGFYEAIKKVAVLGKPIYITENGIADAKDDRRATWINRYLFALGKAIKEGYDVRGYFYWSLLDNFEWDRGFEPKFGLFEVNFGSKELTRTLREGSKPLGEIVSKSQSLPR